MAQIKNLIIEIDGMTQPSQIYRDFINILSGTSHKNRDEKVLCRKIISQSQISSHISKQASGKTTQGFEDGSMVL